MAEEVQKHPDMAYPNLARGYPDDPRSNVAKLGAYDPEKYALTHVSPTVEVDEALLPNRPPCLTQRSIGLYLRPLTREIDEVPPCPMTNELPDSVINRMVFKDLAFWVDKPGANAYTLHEAFNQYNMQTTPVKPSRPFQSEACNWYNKNYPSEKYDVIVRRFSK